MPPEIVTKLEQTALGILAKQKMKKKLTEACFEITASDAKGHAARIAKEAPMYKKIIEDAGIKKLWLKKAVAKRDKITQWHGKV